MKTPKLITLSTAIGIGVASLVTTGCEEIVTDNGLTSEEQQELTEQSIQFAQSNRAMGGLYSDIASYGISEDWEKGAKGTPEVSYDATTNTVTLNYLENGGQITIVWSGVPAWETPNLSATVNITNYTDGEVIINGENLTITKLGTQAQPGLHYTGELRTNNGGVETIEVSDQTIMWLEGVDTEDSNDDVFAYYGTSTPNEGPITTIEAENQLVISGACDYIPQGIMSLDFGDGKSVTLDFGVNRYGESLNECDSFARMTINIKGAKLTSVQSLE